MFFKLTSRNAYRDLVRNARRICVADMSETEKSEAFQELYNMLQQKLDETCLLYTSPSPRDATLSRMPSSA